MATSKRTVYRRAGSRVCILPTPPKSPRRAQGKGLVHNKRMCGTLMEDARIGPEAGWDVYDVKLVNGAETSAYGFDIRAAGRSSRRR